MKSRSLKNVEGYLDILPKYHNVSEEITGFELELIDRPTIFVNIPAYELI